MVIRWPSPALERQRYGSLAEYIRARIHIVLGIEAKTYRNLISWSATGR